ncbi:hypothetical protein LTR08_002621 [Meristemomyces frigidus]|nr:hypothetical protein LTR08_002621 [Meristemomyces frigidus]
MPVTTYPVKGHTPGCAKVCCSGFNQIQFMDEVQFKDPKFAATIVPHALFNNTVKFDFSDMNNLNTPYMDRDCMMPALRLATLLVESTLPFFHTIIYGEFVVLREASETGWKSIQFTNETTELTLKPEWKELTSKSLIMMSSRISIGFDPNPSCSSTSATTDPVTGEVRVEILLNRATYNTLYNAYHSQATDPAQDVLVQTMLAGTLGHEMAHAVMILAHGVNVEAFFGDSPVAEEGYEFEVRAFGGMITVIGTDLTVSGLHHYYPSYEMNVSTGVPGMIVLETFPNRGLVQRYKKNNWKMGVRANVSAVHVRWNTNIAHFIRLFTHGFWEREYTANGIRVVHSPKVTGCRILTMLDGTQVPYEDAPVDGVAIPDTIPTGYRVSPMGLIHPSTGFAGRCVERWYDFATATPIAQFLTAPDTEVLPCFS